MQELRTLASHASTLREISEDVLQKNEGGEQKEGHSIQEMGPTQEKNSGEKLQEAMGSLNQQLARTLLRAFLKTYYRKL